MKCGDSHEYVRTWNLVIEASFDFLILIFENSLTITADISVRRGVFPTEILSAGIELM
jgi:hypothetical protein